MPARILVVYATTHGHTGRIAARVADVMTHEGLAVDLHELRGRVRAPTPAEYDAVVVGASLHAGHHQARVLRWAREHASTLGLRPSALLSVSLTAADDTDEARAATRACVDELIEATGWTPSRVETVAGALQFREYDIATRVLMRLIARHHHVSTDTSEDVDFTDWSAVERFATEFAATVTAATRSPAPTVAR